MLTSLSLSLPAVRFADCGLGDRVLLEVVDVEDFRLDEDGTVYARHAFRLADRKSALVVRARDLETKEDWKTHVYLLLRNDGKPDTTEHKLIKQVWDVIPMFYFI